MSELLLKQLSYILYHIYGTYQSTSPTYIVLLPFVSFYTEMVIMLLYIYLNFGPGMIVFQDF